MFTDARKLKGIREKETINNLIMVTLRKITQNM